MLVVSKQQYKTETFVLSLWRKAEIVWYFEINYLNITKMSICHLGAAEGNCQHNTDMLIW